MSQDSLKKIPALMSKTKIMRGYQCPKSLYFTLHEKHLEPPVGPDLQALFDQGHEVGLEAQKRFPNGVLVDNKPWDFFGALKRTRELLEQKTECIFEAAFEYKGCFARADVIQFSHETQRWSVFEVKSATKVKEEHLDDVGLQVWIMASAGVPIEKINIMHLNTACRFPNLENLFTTQDVTDELRKRHTSIAPKLNQLFKVIKQNETPQVAIGQHCSRPNECVFMDHCWGERKIPETSIFDIPTLKDIKWEFLEKNILDIQDERIEGLDEKQNLFLKILRSKGRFVNKEGLKQGIESWKFPLVFLDFETINPAIPRYVDTGPFMQVPFQFSVHILKNLQEEPTHFEFLYDKSGDPREELAQKLIEACNAQNASMGSVVSYYGIFESTCIEKLEEYLPQYAEELKKIRDRIVDPLPIIREHVYDYQFGKSFSLKSVAPALLGEASSYEGMQVGNGTEAQRAFIELTNSKTPEAKKAQIKHNMLEYCKKDTLVMVDLVKWMFKEIGSSAPSL